VLIARASFAVRRELPFFLLRISADGFTAANVRLKRGLNASEVVLPKLALYSASRGISIECSINAMPIALSVTGHSLLLR